MRHRPYRALFGLVLGLVGCTQGPLPQAFDRSQQGAQIEGARPSYSVQAADANPGVLPPQSKPYGLTYGEWGAKWWQWAFSLPLDHHPLFDVTGADAAVGQSGNVWFLGGVFVQSGQATRSITIPSGTALFFPVLNVETSILEGDGTNEQELRQKANDIVDLATDLSAEIDGKPVANFASFRAESPLFTFSLPADNILGKPATSSPSVTDGYWLFLPPLSVGKHTIHFSGTFPQVPFTLDLQYFVTVEPKGQYKK